MAGRFDSHDRAVAHALRCWTQGADILDIGGESTRPGASEVPIGDEIARTAPVIAALRAGRAAPISIDTRKAAVAQAALDAGADIVNDVSALTWDRDMAGVVADAGVPVCLMHAQGTPQTMQKDPKYNDVRFDVHDWLMAGAGAGRGGGHRPHGALSLTPVSGSARRLRIILHLLTHWRCCTLQAVLSCSEHRESDSSVRCGGADRAPDALARIACRRAARRGQGARYPARARRGQTRQALSLWQALNDQKELRRDMTKTFRNRRGARHREYLSHDGRERRCALGRRRGGIFGAMAATGTGWSSARTRACQAT